jgi:hypothetical protein
VVEFAGGDLHPRASDGTMNQQFDLACAVSRFNAGRSWGGLQFGDAKAAMPARGAERFDFAGVCPLA